MARADIVEKIEKEEKRLKGLKARRAELDKKIKKSEDDLERYRLMEQSDNYTALMEAAKGTGVSISDILSALQSGDLLGLQEHIESLKVSEVSGDSIE